MSGRCNFGIDHYIGGTPLIHLRRLSKLTGCEILAKAEFMNPGGSVKDRTAYSIITEAEAAGKLKPGDTIIEGTAGNTGIGLTLVGSSRGYPTVIVIAENQSPEKIQLLRTLGAKVITVPEKPYSDPANYNRRHSSWRKRTVGFGPTNSITLITGLLITKPPARKYGNKLLAK